MAAIAAAERPETAYPTDTVIRLLEKGAVGDTALAAPDEISLSYGGLRDLAQHTVKSLNGMGIGRGDKVALVLPNGPEMAAAFLAIACAATTAPLNPAYRAEEFEFYIADLKAKALVIADGMESPARAVAAAHSIPILELSSDGAEAGAFSLKPQRNLAGRPASAGPAAADDVALVLHTSGTTARPKIVPLTHRNITASAYHIGATLALTPEDCCLNIMPLFHIHGLIAAVLASLAAGGSVCCSPGFNALKFFQWFDSLRPSWYTAVPTMHQALLARAARSVAAIKSGRLRFVRSASASLPPPVMSELEDLVGVPVIESYGMTEAAHQMTSNPLPPKARYPGCVGPAAGPEIAIMDEAGVLLAPGKLGEVVIRGRNITAGYENNPEANAKAFSNGWLRTGDQGRLDENGYLWLTGRLKELINRGGEKIGPLEIDAVLMKHPAVAQAVAFGMPHKKLGEEVAAAVVLRPGKTVKEHELHDFAAAHLAHFKIPRKIIFVDEIPKGATGKLQRAGLAKKLGVET